MQAADEFERIAKALPDDESAVRSLAAVWHTLNDDQRAVDALETFLRPPRVIFLQACCNKHASHDVPECPGSAT